MGMFLVKKNIFYVLILIVNLIAVFLFGGCSFKDKYETAKGKIVALKDRYEAAKEFDEMQEQHLERCETIVKYLNSGNVQSLYDLYSDERKKNENLMDPLKAFVYYWQLIEVDTDGMEIRTANKLLSYDQGIVSYWFQGYTIYDLTDKYNRDIQLHYEEHNIAPGNENLIGIDSYAIRCDDQWMIYSSTGNDEYDMPDNLNGTVYDRMVAVMDVIDETMLSTEYVNSDKTGKKEIMLDVVNSLAIDGTDELNCPLIRKDTIESEVLNYNKYYNDILLSFRFIDGVKFQIVIY